MGIHQLWEVAIEYTRTSTLGQFGSEFLEANGRWPVVAIDILPFYFEIESGAQASGYDIFHHNFVRRLRGFLKCGIIPIAVFDGPIKRHKLRHKRAEMRFNNSKTILFMKKILNAMGITVVDAKGEGEAECTRIQQKGWADYVFSGDSDCLVFGALKILHFERALKDSKPSNAVYSRPIKIVEIPENTFSQWQFILVAILQGNDFSTGTKNIGHVDAIACSQSKDVVDKFVEWYQRKGDDATEFFDFLIDDLRNDYNGTKTKTWKTKKLALVLDRTLVKEFISPITSSTTLPLAYRSALIWRKPKADALIKLWRSPSPAGKKLAPAKEVAGNKQTKDTIEVIATELWCLHKIMLGEFRVEYTEPLRRLSSNTNFETVSLVHEELWGVCDTVREKMKIKLPTHLTKNFARKEKEAPRPKLTKASRIADQIAKGNSKISFAKAFRSASLPYHAVSYDIVQSAHALAPIPGQSTCHDTKTNQQPCIPPHQQVSTDFIDLTRSSPAARPTTCQLMSSPSKTIDLTTDADSLHESIPTSLNLADSTPTPPAIAVKKPVLQTKKLSTGRTPSVTAFFQKRGPKEDQRSSKRARL